MSDSNVPFRCTTILAVICEWTEQQLVPFLEAARMPLLNQVADMDTIDKTWMIRTAAAEDLLPFSTQLASPPRTTSLLQKRMRRVARSLGSWHISSKRNTLIRASLGGQRNRDFTPTLIPALRVRALCEIAHNCTTTMVSPR